MRSANTHKQRAKLVVLQTHPIQYYAPIYRALAKRGRIEVKVLYLTDAGVKAHHDPGFGQQVAWDIPLLEGYDYRILKPGIGITNSSFWQRHDSSLAWILGEEQPDWILVYGYASRMNWSALSWARKHGVRVAYASDTNVRLMRHDWRMLAKKILVRLFFNRINAFFSPSDANRKYLEFFGTQASKIHWCPFAIEFDRFNSAPPPEDGARIDFVWLGKMIALKRPMDFVNAVNELVRRGHQQVTSLMIGSGPLLDSVHEAAGAMVAKCTISFPGFVNQSKIPTELRRGQIFVFTSEHDQYGLAVTEAAACGLALIVADINGCVGEAGSARPGTNALTYPAGNDQALADCMEALLTDPERLRTMQDASVAIAAEHDINRAAAIIESVIINETKDHA
jgi:glycosyltransferase involved in cell wall biosynthesis